MPNTESPLFDSKVIEDILTKLRFLECINNRVSDSLQTDVREILKKTQNTSESFINAYKEISIATHNIFHEKLNKLRALNVFDETIEQKQKNIKAYEEVVIKVLTEMTEYACKRGAILSTKDEIHAQLQSLQPEIIQTTHLATINSAAALLMRPAWFALASLSIASNPIVAAGASIAFFAAETYKIYHEVSDLNANTQNTYLGIANRLWSKHAQLSAQRKTLNINDTLISDIQLQKKSHK